MARSEFSYNVVPTVRYPRSRQDLSHKHLTACNVGDLIPIDCLEVYPGDTFIEKETHLSRVTSSFIKPVMDNLFIDVYHFFVPFRLLADHWKELWGENSTGPWANKTKYAVLRTGLSQTKSGPDVFKSYVGSLADYFHDIDLTYGFPSYDSSQPQNPTSVMPYRAFAQVWNDWFCSESVDTPCYIQKSLVGDSGVVDNPTVAQSTELKNTSAWSPANYTGKPPKVSKFHDRYTSAFPQPQKGDPVSIPLGSEAPLTGTLQILNRAGNYPLAALASVEAISPIWYNPDSGSTGYVSPVSNLTHLLAGKNPGTGSPGTFADATTSTAGHSSSLSLALVGDPSYPTSTMKADLSSVTATTINDLRYAFSLQKMLERDAIGGTRYTSILLNHYGVRSSDARLQRSEYLGGSRNPIRIQQVDQTAPQSGTGDNALGSVAATSLTSGRSRFSKSFEEHGMILSVACIRQFHTYQQGLPKWHTDRTTRETFYDPVFAGIGMQPIYTKELFATAPEEQIFGYSLAWDELRREPNRVSGAMRSSADSTTKFDSLDIWHFADVYQNAPVLNEQFMHETAGYVDRTLAVPSETAPQFILDFWFDIQAIRRLPTFGMPSLLA